MASDKELTLLKHENHFSGSSVVKKMHLKLYGSENILIEEGRGEIFFSNKPANIIITH